MAVNISFVNDTAAHDATEWANYFRKFITNGVFTDPATGLYVTNPSGLNLSVAAGAAFIDGVQVENTVAKALVLASTPSSRCDRVVVRVDQAAPTNCGIFIVKGTDGSLTPPALASSTSKKELCLCEVTLDPNGVSSISDKRPTSLCGFVQNFNGPIDASGLFSNWEAEFDSVMEGVGESVEAIEEQAQAALSGFYGSMFSNAIINGGFDIDQRGGGSVHAVTAGQAYTLDRWVARLDGAAVGTPSVQRYRMGDGRNCMRVGNKPLSGDGMLGIGQFIENGAALFGGGPVTVHFKAKASVAQKLAVNLQMRYTSTDVANLTADALDVGTDWDDLSFTFTPEARACDETNNAKATIFTAWSGTAANQRFGTTEANGKDSTIYIADVVVCKGSLPMPFSPQHRADELCRCRRFYRKQGLTTLGAGIMKGDKTLKAQAIDFTGMRTAPTVTVTDMLGTKGKASWELTTSGIENGHTATPTSNSDGFAVALVVQPLSASQVQAASIVLGSVEADAEITA